MKNLAAIYESLEKIELSHRKYHVVLYEMDKETEEQAVKKFIENNNAKETDIFIKIGVLPNDRKRASELIEKSKK